MLTKTTQRIKYHPVSELLPPSGKTKLEIGIVSERLILVTEQGEIPGYYGLLDKSWWRYREHEGLPNELLTCAVTHWRPISDLERRTLVPTVDYRRGR
jgi:hypothetical protein